MSTGENRSIQGSKNHALVVAWAIVLWLLVAYCLVALLDPRPWFATLQTGPSPEVLLAMGAKVDGWVAAGHVERLLVSTWLHAGPTHLIVNALWLLLMGSLFKRLRLSASLFFCVWFFSSLSGQLMSFLLQMGPSIGSSGGIYGALGLVSVLLFVRSERKDMRVGVVITACAILLVPYLMRVGSDHGAHLGGMLTGLILSRLIRYPAVIRWLIPLAGLLSLIALSVMGLRYS